MKCQKCGAKMVPGHLYCDNCGAEYQIVPDFEPEIENSIAESLSEIKKELKENGSEKEKSESVKTENNRKVKKNEKRKKPSLGLLFAFVFVFALGFFFGVLKYMDSAAYQEQKALYAIEGKDYSKAAQIYEKIRKQNPKDAGWYIKEAKCRLFMDDGEAAYDLALSSIQAEENLESAYDFLLAYMQTNERYIEMKEILASCKEEAICEKYWEFSGQVPKINYESGSYDHSILLTFEEGYEGTIYYSLDDQIAKDMALEYYKPVSLGNGSHVVTVTYENKYGCISDPVIYEYEISSEIPLDPRVNLENGTYQEVKELRVMVEEGTRVFYTTNATLPTMESQEYTGPIVLPLGESIINLIAYNTDGIASNVTQCRFVVNIKTNVSKEEAKGILIQKLISTGHILDQNGAVKDRYGVFGYFYLYPVSDSGSHYYIFEEHYLENQINNPLGNYYAVDVISGEVYQWVQDASGKSRKVHF